MEKKDALFFKGGGGVLKISSDRDDPMRAKKQNTIKSLDLPRKPPKNPRNKINLKEFQAFQKVLNDMIQYKNKKSEIEILKQPQNLSLVVIYLQNLCGWDTVSLLFFRLF